jgi:hypothetical protein
MIVIKVVVFTIIVLIFGYIFATTISEDNHKR